MRPHPHLYEVNARVLLRRLAEKYERRLTLATIPEKEWQRLADTGFDLVWLMGVWQRSPGARQEALREPDLLRAYAQVLPGWTEADVAGSPYAVFSYELDSELGEPDELAGLKRILNRNRLGLILDFVPNHLALDHPWVASHPDWFVQGSRADEASNPDWFFSPDGKVRIAHGRDPYFPPWADTAQLNLFSKDARKALGEELLRIARVSDGVRCDMAMLVLNGVFKRVWGDYVKDRERPEAEFWPEVISLVRRKRPGFIFLAEAYWGLEETLQEMGFDFTYDKALYDRLRYSTPEDIRSYLTGAYNYQRRTARFIENHDEMRAVAAFGRERSMAAALIVATLPGLRLFHDGQLEGRRIRLPVQLAREPEEPLDDELARFYGRLLEICDAPAFHEGEWAIMDVGQAWHGSRSNANLLAWRWRHSDRLKVVVVNYSAEPSQGRLRLLLPPEVSGPIAFHDELNDEEYIRNPDEIRREGLYVELGPWRAHILDAKL